MKQQRASQAETNKDNLVTTNNMGRFAIFCCLMLSLFIGDGIAQLTGKQAVFIIL